MPTIDERERVVRRCVRLIRGARILGVPILWTEQYRKGLGPTVPEIVEAIGDAAAPMEKMHFGCLDDEAVRGRVEATRRRTLALCGIEAHVCIMNTALRALEDGMRVAVAEDAVGSRRASDRETALRRMTQAGVIPATVEMLLMEWMRESGTPRFKKVLPLLKDVS